MLYMPVWKLEELQTVGADVYACTAPEERNVLLTQEEIKERYKRFGGIIRYIISTDNERFGVLKSSQDSALSHTQPLDIYISGDNILMKGRKTLAILCCSTMFMKVNVQKKKSRCKIFASAMLVHMCRNSYLHSVMTDQMLLESIDL